MVNTGGELTVDEMVMSTVASSFESTVPSLALKVKLSLVAAVVVLV